MDLQNISAKRTNSSAFVYYIKSPYENVWTSIIYIVFGVNMYVVA
mgnify:CR=1 FL=1